MCSKESRGALRPTRRARSPENITSPTLELRLPRRNLIGVNIEMLRQLSQRSVAVDGGERHLGLEYRCVVPALSSAHRFSCSRPSSPLSGRNSTYRPVQICESSSYRHPAIYCAEVYEDETQPGERRDDMAKAAL